MKKFYLLFLFVFSLCCNTLYAGSIENEITKGFSKGHPKSIKGVKANPAVISVVPILNNPSEINDYKEFDVLQYKVTFNQPVEIFGSPYIELQLDNDQTLRLYCTTSGTESELIFEALISSYEEDRDGVTFASPTIALNGGSLTVGGTNALVTLNNISGGDKIRINNVAQLQDVFTSGATYRNDGFVTYSLHFDREVTGLTTDNFALNTMGFSWITPYIYDISGSGTSWDITIQAYGRGDLTLEFDGSANSIYPKAIMAGSAYFDTYHINTDPIYINDIYSYNNQEDDELTFTVDYDTDFDTFDASKFSVRTEGGASGTISSVTKISDYRIEVKVAVSGTGAVYVDAASGSTTNIYGTEAESYEWSTPFYVVSNEARIASMVIAPAMTLNTPFDKDVFSYSANVPYDVTEFTYTPEMLDVIGSATDDYNYRYVPSGGSMTIPLEIGVNTFTISGIAPDVNNTKDYTFTITRADSPTADLAAITISAVYTTLGLDLDLATEDINVIFEDEIVSFMVEANERATVVINGTTVTPNNYLNSFAVNEGENTYNIVVTSPDGTQTINHQVKLIRPFNPHADLSTIFSGIYSLYPAFDPNTLEYSISVDPEDLLFSFFAVPAFSGTEIYVNNEAITIGSETNVTLTNGLNEIFIDVFSADANKTYKVNVTRQVSADATLRALNINGVSITDFDPEKTQYEIFTENARFVLQAYANSVQATMTLNGQPFAQGAATMEEYRDGGIKVDTLEVTAGDGSVKTYYITTHVVTTQLSSLTVSAGTMTPAFDPNVNKYYVTLPDGTTQTNLTFTALEPTVAVDVNGEIIPSGQPYLVDLNTAMAYIEIKVPPFAGSSEPVRSYFVYIRRTTDAPVSANPNSEIHGQVGQEITRYDAGFSGVTNNGYSPFVDPVNEVSDPRQIISDKNGNVFVLGSPDGFDGDGVLINPVLYKIKAGETTPVPFSTSVPGYGLMTADIHNNIYIANPIDHSVTKITPEGISSTIFYDAGITDYDGFAVDSQGNYYVTLSQDGIIGKLDADGSNPQIILSGLDHPEQLIIDKDDTLLFVMEDNVYRLGQGQSDAEVITDDGNNIFKIALDSHDNLFLVGRVNPGSSKIYKYIAQGFVTEMADINGTQGIAFSGDGKIYTLDAPLMEPVTLKKVSPMGGIFINTNLPAGLSFDGSGIVGIPSEITAGKEYTLTAYSDGNFATSTVTIDVVAGHAFTALTASAGSLSPMFSDAITDYTISVPNTVTNISFTPTIANGSMAYVTLNGNTVGSGTASDPITLNVGANNIDLTLTDPSQPMPVVYHIVVTRLFSSETKVKFNLLPKATLTVVPGTADINFSTSVDYNTPSVIITPIATAAGTTITMNGTSVTSGVAIAPITLTGTSTKINFTSTAEDGTTVRTYSVTVNRTGSNNADAKFNFSVPLGLIPVNGPATVNWVTGISPMVSSISVTPTAQDNNAVILINGQVVANNTPSPLIRLNPDSTTIHAKVTAQNGTVKTYAIQIARVGGTNVESKFKLTSNTVLTPSTGNAEVNYTTSVEAGTTSIRVIPTPQDPNSTVIINGNPVASGAESSEIMLEPGETVIEMLVISEIGIFTKSYSITVSRNGSNNAEAKFKMNPNSSLVVTAVGSANLNFVTSVGAGTSTVTLTPSAQDSHAVVRINGSVVASGAVSDPITLTGSTTVINASVTAENGTVKTYSITVSRNGSSNADAKFKLNPNSTLLVTTGSSNVNFTTSVGLATTSVTVTPVAGDENAIIKINDVVVNNLTASAPITLGVGQTVINAVVTAQDGTTVRTYSITVNRNGSNNADIKFKLNPETTLITTTGSSNVNYTTSIPAGLTSVDLSPVAQDANAEIKIEGTTVASLANYTLATPSHTTTINVVVTAEDGTTVKTYSLTFVKEGSNNAEAKFKISPNSILIVSGATANSTSFTTSISASASSIILTPTLKSSAATILIDGQVVASGASSMPIAIPTSPTNLTAVVTAENGMVKTYYFTVYKIGSNNAEMKVKSANAGIDLTTGAGASTVNYFVTVPQEMSAIKLVPFAQSDMAIVLMDGNVIANLSTNEISLNYGNNVVNFTVNAEDNTTVKTYSVTIKRLGAPLMAASKGDNSSPFKENINPVFKNDRVSATKDAEKIVNTITIPNAISPNGDGINDDLVITGLENFPVNKLVVMSRNGTPVFETANYQNSSRKFDGKSPNGDRLPTGTYFYRLTYKADKTTKVKSGFITVMY